MDKYEDQVHNVPQPYWSIHIISKYYIDPKGVQFYKLLSIENVKVIDRKYNL